MTEGVLGKAFHYIHAGSMLNQLIMNRNQCTVVGSAISLVIQVTVDVHVMCRKGNAS